MALDIDSLCVSRRDKSSVLCFNDDSHSYKRFEYEKF